MTASVARPASTAPVVRRLPVTIDRGSPGVIARDGRATRRAAGGETSIRVLVAAGQALVRAGYRAVLERNEAIEVVAEAASGQRVLELISATLPDIALLNVELSGLDVVATTAAIVSRPAFDGVAVMVIAFDETDERVLGAVRAGAVGALSNDAGPVDLIRALELLASGQALFPAGAARHLLAELPPPPDRAGEATHIDELTAREREVLALVGMGLNNGEIARQLVISPLTAKTHVSRILFKLRARDRTKLVILAYEAGVVGPSRRTTSEVASNAAVS